MTMKTYCSSSRIRSTSARLGRNTTRRWSLAIGFAVCLLFGADARWAGTGGNSAAHPGGKENGRWIRLNSYQFDPRVEAPSVPANLRAERPRRDEVAYY